MYDTLRTSRDGSLIAEFTEIETGKGANALERRPELRAALDLARRQGAILVVANLDRLARNVHFVPSILLARATLPQRNTPNYQQRECKNAQHDECDVDPRCG